MFGRFYNHADAEFQVSCSMEVEEKSTVPLPIVDGHFSSVCTIVW